NDLGSYGSGKLMHSQYAERQIPERISGYEHMRDAGRWLHRRSPRRDRASELPYSAMDVCEVCGGALPPVSIRNRDPFCSRACAQVFHGTGDPAERARAARAQLEKAMEDGTDAASLELRRVTVDERTKLIAEGRYGEEFLRAFEAYLIAHKSPVTEATV